MKTTEELRIDYAAYVKHMTDTGKTPLGYPGWVRLYLNSTYGRTNYADTDSMTLVKIDQDALDIERSAYEAVIALMEDNPMYQDHDLTDHLDVRMGSWVIRVDIRAVLG